MGWAGPKKVGPCILTTGRFTKVITIGCNPTFLLSNFIWPQTQDLTPVIYKTWYKKNC